MPRFPSLRARTKGFSGNPSFPLGRRWPYILNLTGNRIDYARQVGDGSGNSALAACLFWIMRSFPEAPLEVLDERPDGTTSPLPMHPMTRLLRRPNPHFTGRLLWMATVLDYVRTGNAYWLKAGSGSERQLWWIPSWMIEPAWPLDGLTFISHYEYTVDGRTIRYTSDKIIHFRFGIDPLNTRKGLSPLGSLLRELYIDDESGAFSAAILKNMGIPGVIIAPDGTGEVIDNDDAKLIKKQFPGQYGGDNRGSALVMPAPVKVTTLAFSPEELGMRDMRRVPEERISAVTGVPAIVAGLGAGLDRSTFANYAEAREAAYEQAIIPMQALLADQLSLQLLPEFGSPEQVQRWVVQFDISRVRVLQTDQDALYKRADMGVRGGWLTVSEGKTLVNLQTTDADDYYLRGISVEAIRPADMFTEPDAPPAPALLPPPEPEDEADDAEDEGKAIDLIESKLLGTDALARIAVRLSNRLARAVARVMGQQTAAATAAARNGAAPDAVLPAEWDARLARAARPYHGEAIGQALATISEDLGQADLPARAERPAADLLQDLGQRIGSVNDTTRARLAGIIREGLAAGESREQIAARIQQVMTDWTPARSLTVARTEIASALNRGTIVAWETSGTVSGVRVRDGDGDERCAAANGQTWTLAQASAEPLGHPNCVRSFSPIMGGEG